MRKLRIVLLSLALAQVIAVRASGETTAWARLGYVRLMDLGSGDSISNDVYPFEPTWQLSLDVTAGGPVTAPRVEFQSSRTFEDIRPAPTGVDPGPTYVWDYPDLTLAQGGTPLFLSASEGTSLAQSGLTASRTVDAPLLTSNSAVQTVDFTLRFDEALPGGVNDIFVGIGTFDFEQDMVAEIVTNQNTVSGWSSGSSTWGNAGWTTGAVTVGVEYHFQAQILSTKRPGYEGQAIYHKPPVYVSYAAINNPPDHEGTWTANVHPLGETATYHVAETVNWDRMTTTSRQDSNLRKVSLLVDDAGLQVTSIEMTYGGEYDAGGAYLGHSAGIDVTGRNMVAASVSTPTGRTWDLGIEDDGSAAWLGLEDPVAPGDLAALGLVSGTYTFTFTGPDGGEIVTCVDLTQWNPEQVPNITSPSDGQTVAPGSRTVTWDAVWDSTVSDIYLGLEDYEDTWEHEVMLPPEASSHLVPGIPGSADIECFLAFGGIVSGTTPEGIEWTAIGYNGREIRFSTMADVPSDTDGDGDVDLDDLFAVRNNFGVASGATRAMGDVAPHPDGDGAVDLDDLFMVRNNFGTGLTVPEPMTLSIIALGGLAMVRRKR